MAKDILSNEEEIKMELGKIYALDYGGNTQIVGRFFKDTSTQFVFFDLLHYWNGFETFKMNRPHCVHSGMESLREASKAEKMALFRFELENNCV